MNLISLAERLLNRNDTLATVESCTGGGIAAACTDLSGSSTWFVGGLVTYSNEMKVRLGVQAESIEQYGAVSEVVARQMAEQGRHYCGSDWAIAVTGVAGPTGGTLEKPVGTVWFAWSGEGILQSEKVIFTGNRAEIRRKTVEYSIDKLAEFIK